MQHNSLQKPKVTTMKTFELVRNDLRILGFLQTKSCPSILSTLSRVAFVADSTMILNSSLWFFLDTAETFDEYVESSYYVLHCFLLLIWYTGYSVQSKTYASLMTEIETNIQKSKNIFFENLNFYFYKLF